MSDEPPRRTDAGDEPFGRPLPEDGLADTMPDWLRRPPAWHGAAPTLPAELPPDTSTIDPNTLIGVEDLPLWLQRIAQREALTPDERAEGRGARAENAAHSALEPRTSALRRGVARSAGVRAASEHSLLPESVAEEGNEFVPLPLGATHRSFSTGRNEASSPWWPIVLALLALLVLIGLAVIAAVYLA